MKFNIEVELNDKEIQLLKSINWKNKQPKEPYGTTEELNNLLIKGVIQYVCDDYGNDYGLFLTKIGENIFLSI